jgi:hypothetical protein
MNTAGEGYMTAEKELAIIRFGGCDIFSAQVPEVSHKGTTLEFHL